ncbi:MAG: hypothetical protein K1563_07820 [Candidatus Thiodiazotropha sp. (ex. Lucinisca nassula)]|nr:hypothetical protein [Candidatus Thiodiazotropha sp. (ex. Lucinisca nassula)]MBW9273581.1 hypothetical protein [Candidatus Thiodiazotropha sp. (ex. Lucinisca nassula)]
MKARTTWLICAVCSLALWGCDKSSIVSSVVKLDDSANYLASGKTIILLEPPIRDFKKIAIMEANSGGNAGLPEMLDRMRKEAQKIGADAIHPLHNTSEFAAPPNIPWIGECQTGEITNIRGIAIIYADGLRNHKKQGVGHE